VKLSFKIKLFILFLYFGTQVFSQKIEDRNLLEKQKEETTRQIEFTQELLNRTRRSRNVTINQINILSKSITGREDLIIKLEEEIQHLENSIEINSHKIIELEKNLEFLRSEYEKLILATYRNIEKESYLEYILGAEDINQSYQRIKQLKYIKDYRKKLYNEIIESITAIEIENNELRNLISEKEKILQQKEKELNVLGREKIEKQRNINQLRTQEGKLITELREKQKIQNRLELEIKKLIEEEIRRSKERNVSVLTPAEKIISGDFLKNMGGLPWPVNRGIITGKYGEHDHPVIKGIKVKSIGIDINTVEGEPARVIFDGEITKIIAIMGANNTIIVKHGEFRTVYQNLVNIKVKTGDMVKKGDNLGTIYTDSNKSTKLHFQIWRDKNNLDPEKWLSKNQ